ncbi:MAG: cobalamin B12-binding domain-containing protein, partial [Candidatus Atribacteria bacterium]|nr:cobalamin B12-binding domain-containing protein [Candidatus Atribacteria bacterium]
MDEGAHQAKPILLLNPPSREGGAARGRFTTPPVGLAYVASSLRQAGFAPVIVDCDADKRILLPLTSQEHFSKTRDYLAQLVGSPLFIGIGSCMTPNWPNWSSLAAFCADAFPGTPVVLGGPHCTAATPNISREMFAAIKGVTA